MISEFRWVKIKRKSGSILLDNQHLLLKALLIIPAINIQQSITEQLKKNNAMKMQSYKGKAVKPL